MQYYGIYLLCYFLFASWFCLSLFQVTGSERHFSESPSNRLHRSTSVDKTLIKVDVADIVSVSACADLTLPPGAGLCMDTIHGPVFLVNTFRNCSIQLSRRFTVKTQRTFSIEPSLHEQDMPTANVFLLTSFCVAYLFWINLSLNILFLSEGKFVKLNLLFPCCFYFKNRLLTRGSRLMVG